MKRLNKKAALIHWVIFGILVAIGVFMMLTFDRGPEELKGERALHLQRLELEKEFFKIGLKNDLLVNAQEVIPCLTGSFGYLSVCSETVYPFPRNLDIREVERKLKNKLKEKVNVENYQKEVKTEIIQLSIDNFDYDLFLDGSQLVFTPNKEVSLFFVTRPKDTGRGTVTTSQYVFYPSLSVDIGYDFDELEEMWEKGNEMWECVENHESSISQLVSAGREEEEVRKNIIKSCYKTKINGGVRCSENNEEHIVCSDWEMWFDEESYFFSVGKRLVFDDIYYRFYIDFEDLKEQQGMV